MTLNDSMVEPLELKQENPAYNSNLDTVEVCIKEEPLFVEDGPSILVPISSNPDIPIKEETDFSSGHNSSENGEDNLFSKDNESSHERNRNDDLPITPAKVIYCHSCPYTTNKLDNFKNHILIHSDNKQLHCDKCDYKCHWKSWMNRHERTHETEHETPYNCNRCDYKTRWKSCIERHALKHDMLKPHACNLCPYTATTKGDLRMHTMIHSVNKRHKCQTCSYSTARRKSLLSHVKNHAEGVITSKRSVRCRRLINESDIRITTATGFRCPHCVYTCETKSNMTRHIVHHFTKPEFQCEQCTYKSHRKDYLKSHMLTHSRIKEFQCAVCNFNCAWRSALRRHMLTHLDERPFQCNDCEFRSSDKSNLKRHVRSHLEIRLLFCAFCEIYFPAVENLLLHKKVLHRRDISAFMS